MNNSPTPTRSRSSSSGSVGAQSNPVHFVPDRDADLKSAWEDMRGYYDFGSYAVSFDHNMIANIPFGRTIDGETRDLDGKSSRATAQLSLELYAEPPLDAESNLEDIEPLCGRSGYPATTLVMYPFIYPLASEPPPFLLSHLRRPAAGQSSDAHSSHQIEVYYRTHPPTTYHSRSHCSCTSSTFAWAWTNSCPEDPWVPWKGGHIVHETVVLTVTPG